MSAADYKKFINVNRLTRLSPDAPHLSRDIGLAAEVVAAWRTIMLEPDLWWWSEARVEIDQRAREARLRLEHLERLLISRLLPTRSWPRRVLQHRALRFFRGGCVQSRSTKVAPPGPRRRHAHHIPTEVCIAAGGGMPVAIKIAGMVRGPGVA